ncbi:hypothetical protein JXK06_02885 [Patescibacteria group bacterium]|nr:hypothetical protein [Patescibacteria group bacterium]
MESLSEIFAEQKNTKKVKPPAYSWQELALAIIKDLEVPDFKKSSVFKICRDLPENKVKIALNDTKELCKSGSKWQYFFKVATDLKNKSKIKQ